jgi:hypothetical protein
MERRKLIIGGGAAAVATTLGALAGASPARASEIAHARQTLSGVDVDLGLVNLEGARSRLKESFAAYDVSAPRDPMATDLHAWVDRRIADLTGIKDSFASANELAMTRTLLAFGFVAYTHYQHITLPTIARSMPVPTVLSKLEPDFFSELHRQIDTSIRNSRTFASQLQTSSTELDRLLTEGSGVMASLRREDIVYAACLIFVIVVAVAKEPE